MNLHNIFLSFRLKDFDIVGSRLFLYYKRENILEIEMNEKHQILKTLIKKRTTAPEIFSSDLTVVSHYLKTFSLIALQ